MSDLTVEAVLKRALKEGWRLSIVEDPDWPGIVGWHLSDGGGCCWIREDALDELAASLVDEAVKERIGHLKEDA